VALLVCRTCPRYDAPRSGSFSRAIGVELQASGVDVRFVQCLGGCPRDGVAAVDGPGKARVRFTGLDAGHGAALIAAARAHESSSDGLPETWEVPEELRGHVSSVTVKRAPAGASRWGRRGCDSSGV
jgi:Predicted metal-binding protein